MHNFFGVSLSITSKFPEFSADLNEDSDFCRLGPVDRFSLTGDEACRYLTKVLKRVHHK